MKLFFNTEGNDLAVSSSNDIPQHLSPLLLDFADATWTAGHYGGYLRQEIASDHYMLTVFDFVVEQPVTLFARTDTPLVTFAFILSGRFECNLFGLGLIVLQEATSYIFYIPPHVRHGILFEPGRYRAYHFSLHPPLLSQLGRDYPAINSLLALMDSGVVDQAKKLEVPFTLRTWAVLHEIQHYQSMDGHLHSFMHSRIFELLVEYTKAMRRPRRFISHFGVDLKTLAERLQHARQLIDNHSGKPLLIEEIARKSGLNSKQLKSGFRDMFRCTIGHYQLLKRMERAVTLLTETNESVELIGEKIGYEDRSSFTRKFKPIYKMTPLQYRVKYKNR